MAYEWVADQGRLEGLAAELAAAGAYAIDTEFHRERTYYPRLALLQVAWPGGLALVDPFAVDLRALAPVLEGPGVAVLHAADQDLDVLERACGAVPGRVFDTQLAAGFVGMSSPSLVTLVDHVLGVRLPKGDRLTDWTRRPLTEHQQAYAASDVEHLLQLRGELVRRLTDRGRLAWAEDESELLRTRRRGAPDPATAWWRLKEARQLRGGSRGVAQEVASWREQRAAHLDVPPRFVLSDLALSSIAQRPPRNQAELRAVRGVDGRQLGDSAAQLLAAVQRGRELPDGALRRPPVDELDRSMRPAVAMASAWVAQLAAQSEIDAALLATRADLQAFLRGEPGARLAVGWRRDVVGGPIRHLVDGKAALALDGSSLVLEARSYEALDSTTAPAAPTHPG